MKVRRLYIVRHADAEDFNPNATGDSARRLTEKGELTARRVFERLRELGVEPEMIVHSPAERTRRTAEIAVGVLEVPEVRSHTGLAITGDNQDVLRLIDEAPVERLMLVGHNPNLAELISALVGTDTVRVILERTGVAFISMSEFAGRRIGDLIQFISPEWLLRGEE